MLAYRNPSNEDSDSIFNYTLKLDAYFITTYIRKPLLGDFLMAAFFEEFFNVYIL